jgi:hypothetical protein
MDNVVLAPHSIAWTLEVGVVKKARAAAAETEEGK